MDGNIGNMRTECTACFHTVALDSISVFKQREVTVILDGSLLSEFKNFVNSVDVRLRKVHPSGYVETEMVGIDYARFTENGRVAKLVYGREENERDGWLNYQYQVTWNFHSNHQVESGWIDASSSYVQLASPLEIKYVTVSADPNLVRDRNIRTIQVLLEYQLGDRRRTKKVRLTQGGVLAAQVPVILPHDSDEVMYRYTLTTTDGRKFRQLTPRPVDLLSLEEITEIPEE